MTDNRPTWHKYYLDIARAVAKRADCSRRQIGAILVTADNRHRGSGYNGGESKGPSCLRGECPRGLLNSVPPGSSYDTGAGACIAVHAEQNLLLDTTPEECKGGKVYVTDVPCDGCMRMLKNSGVAEVIWPKGQLIKAGDGSWVQLAAHRRPARRRAPKLAAHTPAQPGWTAGESISIEDDAL